MTKESIIMLLKNNGAVLVSGFTANQKYGFDFVYEVKKELFEKLWEISKIENRFCNSELFDKGINHLILSFDGRFDIPVIVYVQE